LNRVRKPYIWKVSEWFIPLDAVSEILKNIKERAFESWIPWTWKEKIDIGFESMFPTQDADTIFSQFKAKEINSENLYPQLLIQKENKISSHGLKSTHKYPYATNLYWKMENILDEYKNEMK